MSSQDQVRDTGVLQIPMVWLLGGVLCNLVFCVTPIACLFCPQMVQRESCALAAMAVSGYCNCDLLFVVMLVSSAQYCRAWVTGSSPRGEIQKELHASCKDVI